MYVECKFKPKQGGSEFEVTNITSLTCGAGRPPAINGYLGMAAHDLHLIRITRHRSLQQNAESQLDKEIVKLAAATEKKAYFGGEIYVPSDDDSTSKVLPLRWDTGHICEFSIDVSQSGITETIEVCVTDLQIGDETFKRVNTV